MPTDGQCYQYTLTGTDHVGNAATFQTIVLVDTTGPTGGSISYVDGLASLSSISVDWVRRQRSASPASPRCRSSARPQRSPARPAAASAASRTRAPRRLEPDRRLEHRSRQLLRVPARRHERHRRHLDVHVAVGREDHERLADHRRPGNPAGVYLSGTTVWVGPAAANAPWKLELTGLGQNGVTTATWDGKSAATLTSAPATPTVANSAPFQSGTYTWDGTGTLTDTIHVIRDPGGTDDFVDVRSDTTDPSGSISYPNASILTHSVPVSTTGTDGESGVAGVSVQRSETTLTGSTCGATWSAFAPVTLSGGNDTTVADSMCYRYQVVVTDHVGNSSTFGSASVVQIPDTTPPTFLVGGDERCGHAADDQHERAARRDGDDAGRRVHGRLRRRRPAVADRHRRRRLDGHARPRVPAEQLGGRDGALLAAGRLRRAHARQRVADEERDCELRPGRGRQQHAGHGGAERRLARRSTRAR